MEKIYISVVIPVHNEEKNIKPLFSRIKDSLTGIGKKFEVIFVNDGSKDQSINMMTDIYNSNNNVSIIDLYKCYGKAAALERGFELAKGEYIVIIDADLQNPPEDIPKLIAKIEEGYDVVSGERVNRQDPYMKVLTSKIFNLLVRIFVGLKLNDYFSGLKCFRAKVIRALELYGDLYRFASVFAHMEGFKVVEVPIQHHNRKFGRSTYTKLKLVKRGILDLLMILFTITFDRKRIYFIGLWGIVTLSLGITFNSIIFVYWFEYNIVVSKLLYYMGIMATYIGIQMLFYKKIANDFVTKHQEEREIRKRYIKEIHNKIN